MCVVSMIHDYFGDPLKPNPFNNEPWRWDRYKKFIKEAEELDRITGQPDCESPEKVAKIKKLEDQMEQLKANLIQDTATTVSAILDDFKIIIKQAVDDAVPPAPIPDNDVLIRSLEVSVVSRTAQIEVSSNNPVGLAGICNAVNLREFTSAILLRFPSWELKLTKPVIEYDPDEEWYTLKINLVFE